MNRGTEFKKTPAHDRSLGIRDRRTFPSALITYQPNPRGRTVLTTGRSSDLSINTFLRLPRLSLFRPVTYTFSQTVAIPKSICIKSAVYAEAKLLSYSDGFVQDLHLLPFSSDQDTLRYLSDTCNASIQFSVSLSYIITNCNPRFRTSVISSFPVPPVSCVPIPSSRQLLPRLSTICSKPFHPSGTEYCLLFPPKQPLILPINL